MTSNFIEQFGFNDEEFADQDDVVEWVLILHDWTCCFNYCVHWRDGALYIIKLVVFPIQSFLVDKKKSKCQLMLCNLILINLTINQMIGRLIFLIFYRNKSIAVIIFAQALKRMTILYVLFWGSKWIQNMAKREETISCFCVFVFCPFVHSWRQVDFRAILFCKGCGLWEIAGRWSIT